MEPIQAYKNQYKQSGAIFKSQTNLRKGLSLVLKNLIGILIGLLLLSQSAVGPGAPLERIRSLTRMIEFDYVNWTINAFLDKDIQAAVRAPSYMTRDEQRRVVSEYFRVVQQVNQTSARINVIYADPDITNPERVSADDSRKLDILKSQEQSLKQMTEAILQYQVSSTIAKMGIGYGGQPLPPVLYHATQLPDALIISPRSVIRQDADISLVPELPMGQITQLEENVEQKAGVSALVVPIGGVGIYPTMVMNTTDLNWLLETISHEWTHNFLTLRPLGLLYETTPEMRTINETTANLSGKEIGLEVLKHFYPDLVPPEVKENPAQPAPLPAPEDPNKFNFNREMHKTRVQVDTLLAAGKIKEADDYMEQRRRFFWDNGYQIRKLNQAYFAFYGAYNDQPGGGAAGTDPVGPAVQQLREQSKSLADFLNRIAWVTSFQDLKKLLSR